MKHYKTFQDAFLGNAQFIMDNPDYENTSRTGDQHEMIGFAYTVDDPTTFEFKDKEIGRIKYDYASYFYDWMMSGCGTEATQAFMDKYPHVTNY